MSSTKRNFQGRGKEGGGASDKSLLVEENSRNREGGGLAQDSAADFPPIREVLLEKKMGAGGGRRGRTGARPHRPNLFSSK